METNILAIVSRYFNFENGLYTPKSPLTHPMYLHSSDSLDGAYMQIKRFQSYMAQ